MDPDWSRHCAEPAVAIAAKATGRDIWGELGGCPRNWAEAAELYRRIGARNLADVVTHVLGLPVDPKRAMRGDICMVDGALGICRGEWVECIDRMQPLRRATAAWSVKAGLDLADDCAAGPDRMNGDAAA